MEPVPTSLMATAVLVSPDSLAQPVRSMSTSAKYTAVCAPMVPLASTKLLVTSATVLLAGLVSPAHATLMIASPTLVSTAVFAEITQDMVTTRVNVLQLSLDRGVKQELALTFAMKILARMEPLVYPMDPTMDSDAPVDLATLDTSAKSTLTSVK